MNPRKENENLRNELIENIEFVALHRKPKNWLPIKASVVVYLNIDDVPDDGPILNQCIIKEILDGGECNVITSESEDEESYELSEFPTEDLVSIWEKYTSLSIKKAIWKRNAVEYLKENTEFSKDKIKELVDRQWNPLSTFTENLKAIRQQEARKELWIFSYPMNRFERNASDEEIVSDYENHKDAESLVVKMTPLEFTALINDDMFNDTDNWVRAIELTKQ